MSRPYGNKKLQIYPDEYKYVYTTESHIKSKYIDPGCTISCICAHTGAR